MSARDIMTREEIVNDEEILKEHVYDSFDKRFEEERNRADKSKELLYGEEYEEKYRHEISSNASSFEKRFQRITQELLSLFADPYFAHIKVTIPKTNEVYHCLLSRCPNLSQEVGIDKIDQEDVLLLPFEFIPERRVSEKLFMAYTAKSGDPFTVTELNGDTTEYQIDIMRDVTIKDRVITRVEPYIPNDILEAEEITYDDILEQILNENRTDAELRNIISTLQLHQFRIISEDQDSSFVVQGCVGSGKSQCLIHRLKYFRSHLSSKGWNKVLLITPTQLFREYSATLIKDYHLDEINNCSIAELYRDLLLQIDDRFKNRQYQFELTEEYLPDGFLQEVYSRRNISRIQEAINTAIKKRISIACAFIGIQMSEEYCTKKGIEALSGKLRKALAAISLKESEWSKDEEYVSLKKEYQSVDKEHKKLQKEQSKLCDDLESLKERHSVFKNVQEELARTESSLTNLGAHDTPLLNEYAGFLQSYIELCQQELKSLADGRNIKKFAKALQQGIERNELQLKEISDCIKEAEKRREDVLLRLEEYTGDTRVRSIIGDQLSEIQSVASYLSRIEVSLFEQEAWKVLSDIKERYGISSIEIEDLGEGKHRETKVLFKSDLLFYLRVYLELKEVNDLPPYEFICIDEGQDLHKLDYDTLRLLFPQAVFNIFGDVAQVLHSGCGITDWKKGTGIEKVFELSRNYRNTPAVVEFIKESFGAEMEAVGKIRQEQEPVLVTCVEDVASILKMNKGIVVIVKDKQTFESFCGAIDKENVFLNYIDTKSGERKEGMIQCYSIYAAKGLEFPKVMVWPEGMTKNQSIVACSRALDHLYYCDFILG